MSIKPGQVQYDETVDYFYSPDGSTCQLTGQKLGEYKTAKKHGLKGAVHTVEYRWASADGKVYATSFYENDRKGKERIFPHYKEPSCILTPGLLSSKIDTRNGRGDVEEVSIFLDGELESKEKYEYEYDSVGNWVRMKIQVMRTYDQEGSPPAGTWWVRDLCTRRIEYYSGGTT